MAILLLIPLYLYIIYSKNFHEVQLELQLKRESLLVIKAMEEFGDSDKKVFDYPKFSSFKSGLYDDKFHSIYTEIEAPIKRQKSGIYIDSDYIYLVVALPEHRYFDASFLVLESELSYAKVYQDATMILFAIALLIFTISLFFLDRFAKPFKKLNDRLDKFIKDSMHEINTPLSIINVNIDLYSRLNSQNKYLSRIKAASKTLSNIYNDMDYLIKNDRLEFKYETINLGEFLQERCDYFYEVAAMHNIEIHRDIDMSVMIDFNPTQLQRIIDNNISNAIKYSPEGRSIEAVLYKNSDSAVMEFRDNGVGIEDVDQIFDRYYRENGDKGGFGIGLNIVKSIIDKAGIKLEIESEYGKGSTFRYIFYPPIFTI